MSDRLVSGLKRFQPIIQGAVDRDVNESDTSMIVTDLLADLFGYDKYNEITRELCIRGTYCDIATKVDGRYQMLVEVKAIGVSLRDSHVKQAVDYAANQGIEWVALTTGRIWRVYRVVFSKPVDAELSVEIDLLGLNPKERTHIENIALLTRESMTKSKLQAFHDRLQATSRFYLGAILLSDPVLDSARRELRRLSDVKISNEELRAAIERDVIKRDVLEGDKAELAAKKVARSVSKLLRSRKDTTPVDASPGEASPAPMTDIQAEPTEPPASPVDQIATQADTAAGTSSES
jgi:predicted type IV restriction endonuclease